MVRYFVLFLTFAACAAQAQTGMAPGAAGAPRGTELATRSVSAALALERSLLRALQEGDREKTSALLDDEFAEHKPADGDHAEGQDKSAWLAEAVANPLKSARIVHPAVEEFGGFTVASFLLDRHRTVNGRDEHAILYVIDVWGQGRLVARYLSQPREHFVLPQRPSGRE